MARIFFDLWVWLVFLIVGLFPETLAARCPRCGGALESRGVLEVLIERGDRYLGWHRIVCTQCPYGYARLTVTRDTSAIVRQTHRVR